ncbi:hypothetical protein [Poriferisphaera sp. WC338]|uniref:hypothetical protein n=1 Tax=Poriferisphaera sp. WC338 TaxID=3425129 RepID=UPI003D81ACC2
MKILHGKEEGGKPLAAASKSHAALKGFDVRVLRRQLAMDLFLRWVSGVGMVVLLVYVFGAGGDGIAFTLGVVLLIFGWFALNAVNARTGRELSQMTGIIEIDPAGAERWLAGVMERRPLIGWVRLMIYHRVAMLRHKQERFSESAAICRSVLGYRLGPAEGTRGHLLLILSEASLEIGDIASAYSALRELYGMRVSLMEALQRLALQVRYELMSGNERAAVTGVDGKMEMAELLPGPQCGAVHEMLRIAAERCGEIELAMRLKARSELLCSQTQRDKIREGLGG